MGIRVESSPDTVVGDGVVGLVGAVNGSNEGDKLGGRVNTCSGDAVVGDGVSKCVVEGIGGEVSDDANDGVVVGIRKKVGDGVGSSRVWFGIGNNMYDDDVGDSVVVATGDTVGDCVEGWIDVGGARGCNVGVSVADDNRVDDG